MTARACLIEEVTVYELAKKEHGRRSWSGHALYEDRAVAEADAVALSRQSAKPGESWCKTQIIEATVEVIRVDGETYMLPRGGVEVLRKIDRTPVGKWRKKD